MNVQVRDSFGTYHEITDASEVYSDEEERLVVMNGNDFVAMFARGKWVSAVKQSPVGE